MKPIAIGLIAGLVVVFLAARWGGASARADNGAHVKGAGATADSCAACHRAHTGKADQLLVDVQPAICYTCHGTAGVGAQTAVENGTFYTTLRTVDGGALKGGGFATARIQSNDASLPPGGASNTGLTDAATHIGVLGTGANTTSRHTIDGSNGTMWGSGATGTGTANGVRCGSCHDPHGNGQFRVLRTVPTGSGAATGTNVADEATKNYTTTDYLYPLQGLGTGAAANMSSWCSTCHTRYLSTATTGDTNFNFRHKSESTGIPSCTNCHVAHGTNASVATGPYSAAVKQPDGTNWAADASTPALPGSANSRLLRMDNRGICQKCHNK